MGGAYAVVFGHMTATCVCGAVRPVEGAGLSHLALSLVRLPPARDSTWMEALPRWRLTDMDQRPDNAPPAPHPCGVCSQPLIPASLWKGLPGLSVCREEEPLRMNTFRVD